MRVGMVLSLILALVLGWSGPAAAHHGWTSYNSEITVTVTGTVREAAFEHPHVLLRVEARDRTWHVTLPPPTRAATLGLRGETLRVGMAVTLLGHPHRSSAGEMRATRITIGDRTIALR